MFAAKLDLLSPVIQSKQTNLLSLCLYIHYRASERNMELDFTKENDIRFPCDDTSDTSVPDYNSSLRVSSSDFSWPHINMVRIITLDPNTECRERDRTFMMQHSFMKLLR